MPTFHNCACVNGNKEDVRLPIGCNVRGMRTEEVTFTAKEVMELLIQYKNNEQRVTYFVLDCIHTLRPKKD